MHNLNIPLYTHPTFTYIHGHREHKNMTSKENIKNHWLSRNCCICDNRSLYWLRSCSRLLSHFFLSCSSSYTFILYLWSYNYRIFCFYLHSLLVHSGWVVVYVAFDEYYDFIWDILASSCWILALSFKCDYCNLQNYSLNTLF